MTVDIKKTREYAKLRLLNPEMPKAQARTAAGFPSTTHPYQIERSVVYKDIAEETRQAALNQGVTPDAIMETLKRSMDRSKENAHADSTANNAAKIAGEFLGMTAPIKVQTDVAIKQHTLVSILDRIGD